MSVLCASLTTPDGSFPPTPTSDSTSKRLSWSKLVQKLTDFSGSSVHQSLDSDCDSDSCCRSDDSDTGSALLSLTTSEEYDLFYDPMEEMLRRDVVDLIARSLTDAKEGALRCAKLIIPDLLLDHIGQELLHLAASEPCGLRGALIDLCVEQQDICQSVEQIAVDPCLVPTFQLTLVLRLESRGLWPKIQGLFSAKSPSVPMARHALRLRTGFRVIKKKLYSSEELLIEEC
ncbi:DNA damage-inducible transcript 4 protein [Scleropages formosus]|uniref:DNA damage-inducible transcript 4 protein n=1 Tax=Scleropages formosus TaxID=113540 RepID=A0A8D0C6W1_SCLFO|nr:DNA damage-inducible transcript 4 protein [Scleropages formosus]